MIAFYCSRRSRSSKLSFCSPQGARAAAVRACSALCVLYERRGRSGPLRLKCFYWGQALGGRLNIAVGPFCAAVRVNPPEWDVGPLWGQADQIEIWHS